MAAAAIVLPLSLRSQCAHWLWQSASPVLLVGANCVRPLAGDLSEAGDHRSPLRAATIKTLYFVRGFVQEGCGLPRRRYAPPRNDRGESSAAAAIVPACHCEEPVRTLVTWQSVPFRFPVPIVHCQLSSTPTVPTKREPNEVGRVLKATSSSQASYRSLPRSVRAHSLRCSSSPHKTNGFVGTPWAVRVQ